MSANIYWEPARRDRESLWTMAPSAFRESLEAAGIPCPGIVNMSHMDALRGMSRVHGQKPKENPYFQLIMALEEHHEIELTVEF